MATLGKACSKCKQVRTFEEFHRDRYKDDGRAGQCKECGRAQSLKWRRAHRAEALAILARWRARNADRERQYRLGRYHADAVESAKRMREWRAANFARDRQKVLAYRERTKAQKRLRNKAWRAANGERSKALRKDWVSGNRARVALQSRMRARLARCATPGWANTFFMDEIYDLAQRRTRALGVAHHVDHVVPLIHPLVCGLHWEGNMRVIPASINAAKGNRHWPDMPTRSR